jgi:hypothetical protein
MYEIVHGTHCSWFYHVRNRTWYSLQPVLPCTKSYMVLTATGFTMYEIVHGTHCNRFYHVRNRTWYSLQPVVPCTKSYMVLTADFCTMYKIVHGNHCSSHFMKVLALITAVATNVETTILSTNESYQQHNK